MREVDPLFPRTILGRLQLAAESVFFLFLGVWCVFNWPPVPIAAQGIWAKVFLAICFEIMLALIPLSILGLWWAIATPKWMQSLLRRAFNHAGIAVFALILFGAVGMIAGALGWW